MHHQLLKKRSGGGRGGGGGSTSVAPSSLLCDTGGRTAASFRRYLLKNPRWKPITTGMRIAQQEQQNLLTGFFGGGADGSSEAYHRQGPQRGGLASSGGDNDGIQCHRQRMRPRQALRIAAWHVALYCFVVGYILGGAWIFHYLEGEYEIHRHASQWRQIHYQKRIFLRQLRADHQNKALVERHLRRFLENISATCGLDNYLLFDDDHNNIDDDHNNNNERVVALGVVHGGDVETTRLGVPKRWTFPSSVLFAFTILTTIGYGNVAPTTTICQVFTMVYGAFGIPLFLITIADIGRFFKTFIMFIIQRLFGRETLKKSNADRHLLREIGEVILVALLFLTFIAVGSAVLPLWEHDLTYFNSVYFSYMSLTTIGLGDIVPRRMDFLLPTLLYITIGLWLTTAMVEQLADVFRLFHYAGRHVSNVKTIKIWLGGHQVSVGSLIQTICRRVGMSDTVSGRINWDRTIDSVLNGEPPPLVPIFPWHFADFLEHDPPLIDEVPYEYDYYYELSSDSTHANGAANGTVTAENDGGDLRKRSAAVRRNCQLLKLSPLIGQHQSPQTAAPAAPPESSMLQHVGSRRRNLSAPPLDRYRIDKSVMLRRTATDSTTNPVSPSSLPSSATPTTTPPPLPPRTSKSKM